MKARGHRGLWSELQRRQVPKAAAGYAVGAWLLLQVADVTFGPLGVPEWVNRVLVVASMLGLPLVVALAWFFDLSRRGITRESESGGAPAASRMATLVIATCLGAAVVGIAAYVIAPRFGERYAGVKTVAVFRFDNLSGDARLDDIAAGVSDELRRRLGPVPGLSIIARDSVQSPVLVGLGNADVAQRLGATHAVRGSLRRSDSILSVQVSLERMGTGEPLWSAQFERDATQLLEVQSLVSEAVGQALVRHLSDEQRAKLRQQPTSSRRAWELYQRAVTWSDDWTLQSAMTAIAQMQEATRLDPRFALGYATMADAYWGIQQMAQRRPSEFVQQTQDAIDRALALDPNLAEAWSNSAALRDLALMDGPNALPMHRRAVALDPNSRVAWLNYAQHFIWYGPYSDEARKAVATLQRIDPVGLFSVGQTALLTLFEYQTTRDPRLVEEALASIAAAKQLGPQLWAYTWWECWLLPWKGESERAIPVCEQALEFAEGSIEPIPGLAVAYATAGRREEALAIVGKLEREAQQRYVPPVWFALIHAAIGDRAACLDALEKSIPAGDWELFFYVRDPVFDWVRDDPRFQAVYQKLHIAEPRVRRPSAIEPVLPN